MPDYVLEGPKWGAAPLGSGGGTVYWSFADPANGHRFFEWDTPITGLFRTEVERAFDRWQSVADIQLVEVPDSPSVNIRLAFDAIDGIGGVAGQAQYNYGPDNKFHAAEVRFDNTEGWHIQNGVGSSALDLSFFVLALHEIGHTLGLGHYNAGPAVMNRGLTSSLTDLTQSDQDGISALYGNNGSMQFEAPQLVLSQFGTVAGGWFTQDQYPRLLGDVNADGKSDVIGFSSNGVILSLNQGNRQFEAPQLVLSQFGTVAGGWFTQDQYLRLLGDVNGDG